MWITRRVRDGVAEASAAPPSTCPASAIGFAFPASPHAAYWRAKSRLGSRSKIVSGGIMRVVKFKPSNL
jgi:hypothetical protein